MARKNSNAYGARGGSYENPYARKPAPASRQNPIFPAPDSDQPTYVPPSDTGPQRGLMKVVSQPGDPNFAHDEAEKELSSFVGLGHPKSYRVGIHPAHDKNMPKASGPIAEDGASAVAFRSGLDSAE